MKETEVDGSKWLFLRERDCFSERDGDADFQRETFSREEKSRSLYQPVRPSFYLFKIANSQDFDSHQLFLSPIYTNSALSPSPFYLSPRTLSPKQALDLSKISLHSAPIQAPYPRDPIVVQRIQDSSAVSLLRSLTNLSPHCSDLKLDYSTFGRTFWGFKSLSICSVKWISRPL
ncbi:hypothetical protein CFOL_v3_28649 [Cephalotus follicularis]|uniref:Uncharacterized protein n=1 Tax=Cephalotus follicularis TaxID=3775 RepID=A0A1Q3CYI5_CEPFO|nr:hypothetical protein CFOL_v3_28649 [Cephalotus follicularis]